MHHVLVLSRLWLMYLWAMVVSSALLMLMTLWLAWFYLERGRVLSPQTFLFVIEGIFSMTAEDSIWAFRPSHANVILSVVVWTMTFLMAPASLVLLPQTRLKAKLHGGHVLRMLLYSAGLIPVLLAMRLLLFEESIEAACDWAGYYDIEVYEWPLMSLSLIVQAVILWWFWRCALRHYARIPHAGGVATAAMAIALLLGLALAMATGQIVLA
jgi:hypothetical protein